MTGKERMKNPRYLPNRLLNTVMEMLGVETDRALASRLDVNEATISRIRNRKSYIGPTLLVRIHDLTGLTLEELRELMGEGDDAKPD